MLMEKLKIVKYNLYKLPLKYKNIELNNINKVVIGNEGANFCICTDAINKDSIVYSFGIGYDISFDLELIDKFGCEVLAFDPTPRCLSWLNKQNINSKFKYKPIGLSDLDGHLNFVEPDDKKHFSYSSERVSSNSSVYLPVNKLSSIMKMYNHKKIDLLKIDIEGSEYGVIKDIVKENIQINQIVLEFHHRFKGIGYKKTNEAIEALIKYGYKMFYISENGAEMSFIK